MLSRRLEKRDTERKKIYKRVRENLGAVQAYYNFLTSSWAHKLLYEILCCSKKMKANEFATFFLLTPTQCLEFIVEIALVFEIKC